MATYVDLSKMSATLEDILGHIRMINSEIEGYKTDAITSLGDSTFRPAVEANLEGIKKKYQELGPSLEKMEKEIEAVMMDYGIRASKVANATASTKGVSDVGFGG